MTLYSHWFETPLGRMLAVSDDTSLYLLEFFDRKHLDKEIARLQVQFNTIFQEEISPPIMSIKEELNDYFAGTLQEFKTPFTLLGTDFQKEAWQALVDIPYGVTRSYLEQSNIIGKPKAFRAVANANGKNQLAIIIPCHRVIQHNGALGGYGAGVSRKKWLLEHEKN